MSHLTSNQKDVLKSLRDQLEAGGYIQDDAFLGLDQDETLLRFLRARYFNLDQAKTMIVNCVNWRRTVGGEGIDDIYRNLDPLDFPEKEAISKYWPIYFHKTDKTGRPVCIQNLGGIDVKSLFNSVSPERHWQYIVTLCDLLPREILPACSHKVGRDVKELCIVDLKGFSLTKFWQMKDLVRDSFGVSQNYYPELMGQLVVINAPSSFALIYAAVRPWLSKETQDKINILGSNYEPALLNLIDAENLPEYLGGRCTCDAEGGCAHSNTGPWMKGRKERREAWLKGERSSPGLPPISENGSDGDADTTKGDVIPNMDSKDPLQSNERSVTDLAPTSVAVAA